MSDIVLEIKALTRRFGAFTAVDALTLSVNAGEVFGLLGSNGAGKTTTIKMLTTLLAPSSGEARVADFSITSQAVDVRRAIGYVPQAVSVDGSLTGYENLLIFAKLYDLPHREQQARIREALDFMGLTADGGRLVGQYSGGMVRRLEIAQSTLHRPRVLFLDEPTVGLDPIARDAVWKHLVGVGSDGHTYLPVRWLRQAVLLKSFPRRAAIIGAVKAAARPTAGQAPCGAPRLPQGRIKDVGVMGIEGDVDSAGVLVLVQDFLPGLATIERAENAAFLVGTKGVAERGDKHPFCIPGIDDDFADRARIV
jgi:ABC-2 type transport system ATP-binding protein